MRFSLSRFAAVVVLCSSTVAAHAAAVDQLRSFLSQTQSAQARFVQRVYDRTGKRTQETSGTLAFQRPGKFRWVYEKPFAQLIVGDGQKVWIYDQDLNQVTVKAIDSAFGTTPAAFLAGDKDVEKSFDLKNLPDAEGLAWAEATPKAESGKEAGFAGIRFGFAANGLTTLRVTDNFGQTTVITLDKLERNAKVAPDQFKFVPPKGADVVGG